MGAVFVGAITDRANRSFLFSAHLSKQKDKERLPPTYLRTYLPSGTRETRGLLLGKRMSGGWMVQLKLESSLLGRATRDPSPLRTEYSVHIICCCLCIVMIRQSNHISFIGFIGTLFFVDSLIGKSEKYSVTQKFLRAVSFQLPLASKRSCYRYDDPTCARGCTSGSLRSWKEGCFGLWRQLCRYLMLCSCQSAGF